MPLIRRVPKFGFHSPFKVAYQIVNVSTLEILASKGKFADGKVSPETLYAAGAVAKKTIPVKILGNGEIKAKLAITTHAFSESAKKKIEAAGGTVKSLASSAK